MTSLANGFPFACHTHCDVLNFHAVLMHSWPPQQHGQCVMAPWTPPVSVTPHSLTAPPPPPLHCSLSTSLCPCPTMSVRRFEGMSVSHGLRVCPYPTVWGYVRVPRCLSDGLRACPCSTVSVRRFEGMSVSHGVCPPVWGYVRIPRFEGMSVSHGLSDGLRICQCSTVCLSDGLRVCPCSTVCPSDGLRVFHVPRCLSDGLRVCPCPTVFVQRFEGMSCPTVFVRRFEGMSVSHCLYDGLRICPRPMVSGCLCPTVWVCPTVRVQGRTWQVYCFGKRNVLRLDLNESSEGFLQSRSIVLEKEMFWG